MRDLMFDLARKLFDELSRRGVQEAEFYGVWSRNVVVEISRNHVKSIVHKNIVKYGVRGAYNRRVAGISSEDLGVEPSRLADELLRTIKASQEISDWPGFSTGYSRGVMASIYDNRTANIGIEDLLVILKNTMDEAIDAATSNGSEKSIITRSSLTIGSGGVFIANIYGENLYEEYTFTNLALTVKSRRGGGESSFEAYVSGRRINEEEFLREARRAGEYSVKFINPKTIPSGKYTVVIDPYMTALFILSALAPAFSALNVQEKRSPLRNKLDKKILSENIVVTDEPGINWSIGSRSFDDEGIPTRTKTLVDKGVLTGYLYDYYTASREGRRSTGNGFRRQPASSPTPMHTNLVVKASSNAMSIDEMIKEVDRGVIIHGMIGYWMSNFVNGSVQATITHGLYIENGEVKFPVKGLVIGGNIYDWLGKDLVGVSRETYRLMNIYAPQVIVSEARIASK